MADLIVNTLKQVISGSFTDFDALTETLQGWNLELYKLDTSAFTGSLSQLISEDLILSHGRFSSRLKQIGEPPRGYRTFGVPISADMQMLWRGKHVEGNDLILFPPGGELYASTNSGFNIITVSIKDGVLHEIAEQLQFHGLEKQFLSSEVYRCDEREMTSLKKTLYTVFAEHERDPALDPAGTARQIAMRLIQVIHSASRHSLQQPTPLRQEVVRKVDQHIFQYVEEPPTIPELCAVTGASKRTLEYAFNEYFGLNPKAYVNAMRLNAVRKQLRGAQAGDILVADVANTWGFWHMGQFAADYRKLFGENPSITLGCDVKPCKAGCSLSQTCQTCRH